MKKFFTEFKKFISRGNVIDMAVGIIIGSAFTAIVTAMTKNILQPVINYLIALVTGGTNGLAGAVTFLQVVTGANGEIDLAKSIYIDWGALITSIINFILIAFVLFSIVKIINRLQEVTTPKFYGYTRKEYIKFRKEGKTVKDIEAMAKERDEAAAAKKKAEEEEAKKHTTEGLLEDIKALLEKQLKD